MAKKQISYPDWLNPPAPRLPTEGTIRSHRIYERYKEEWIEEHPEATPEEYQAAIRAIADEIGV